MFEAIKGLILGPGAAEQPAPARDQALRLAAAALLFEVVRADGDVQEAELTVMRAALQSVFSLEPAELDHLVADAERRSREATSLYELTHLLDQELKDHEKKRIVELLWLVAFADGHKDALEEQTVRKAAGLLHVSHPDFIDAKIRARGRSEGGEPG